MLTQDSCGWAPPGGQGGPATAQPKPVSTGGFPGQRPQALWCCVHFPLLALDIHPPSASEIRAVVDAQHCLHAVSKAARAAGMKKGMSVGAALALNAALRLLPRDVRGELEALKRAGRRCRRLTPTVSLAPPDAVLLEIGGSLRLFGGFEGMRAALGDAMAPLGAGYCWASAPTPEASLLLARCQRACNIARREDLPSALGAISLGRLDIDAGLLARLHKTGLRRLRDLWRLPRDGLARRFGPELLAYLDRIRGERPDPRPLYRPPLRFRSRLELPTAVSEHGPVVAAAEKLLQKLVRFLRRWDAGTTAVCIRLRHPQRPTTSIPVGTRHNTCDGVRLLRLFEQALEHRRLPEPVVGVAVQCVEIHPWAPARCDLFDDAAAQAQDWQHALEEIEARLGAGAVRQVRPLEDHRPERAWTHRTDRRRGGGKPAPRPLWLLAPPQPLNGCGQGLRFRGCLTLQSGPERIESGWWDGEDRCRDYYIARNPRGERLWIFQDLKHRPGRWYLHGLFG